MCNILKKKQEQNKIRQKNREKNQLWNKNKKRLETNRRRTDKKNSKTI